MEFEPTEFVRKSFTVRASEVTFRNVEAVAEWCGGRVEMESTKLLGGVETDLPVVKFPGQGEDRGKDLVARLGYYIVESKGRFRVYKEPQFFAAFEQKVVLQEPLVGETTLDKALQEAQKPETVNGVIDGEPNYEAEREYHHDQDIMHPSQL